jgi:DNA-directed RNA polymerase subunit beta
MVKELQSLALDIRVLDKEGNEIELSNLCQEEDSRTSRVDREAIDAVLGQRATDEELRRSFLMEDENGDIIEDEEEEDSFFDETEEEDSFFATAEELMDSDYED